MSRLRTGLGAPVAHFLAIGALLALGRAVLSASSTPTIQVTPDVVTRLAAALGTPADRPLDRDAFERWIDDEVLYREGVRRGLGWNPAVIARFVQVGAFVGTSPDGDGVGELGLDRDDPVVRAQVVGRMRLLLGEEAMRGHEPTADDLARVVALHPERFVEPGRTTFAHVFVRRSDGAREHAAAIGRRIDETQVPVVRAPALGDVFRPGERFERQSRHDVAVVFGPEVADALVALDERRWSAPVESPYGWHLLWVESREPARPRAPDAVRAQARREWRATQSAHRVPAAVAALRARYRIEIDPQAHARVDRSARGEG
jgi:hypothetical protein